VNFGFNFGLLGSGAGANVCGDFFKDGSQIFGVCFEDNLKDRSNNFTLIPDGSANYSYVAGAVRKAVAFPDDNSYLTLDSLAQPKSISFWVKCFALHNGIRQNTFIGNDKSFIGFELGKLTAADDSGNSVASIETTWQQDEWHHVVLNANSEVWIDGLQVQASGASFSFSVRHLGKMLLGASPDEYHRKPVLRPAKPWDQPRIRT